MKKFLAAALALTMTAAMFTACGDDASSSEAETTTTTTTAKADASSEEAPAESTESTDASSAEGGDASSDEGGEAATGEFDVTKLPGYDASATETVLTVAEPSTTEWANGLGTAVDKDGNINDVYIDARTFTRDQDLTVKVDFELSDDILEQFDLDIKRFESLDENGNIKKGTVQLLIGPCRANGWAKFLDKDNTEGLIVDFPTYYNMPEGDTHGIAKDGSEGKEDVYKADGTLEETFVKNDGFIKFGSTEVRSVEFTIPAETVNSLIDNAFATPDSEDDLTKGWDGLIFQCAGQLEIKTVTLSQGNIYFSNVVNDTFAAE